MIYPVKERLQRVERFMNRLAQKYNCPIAPLSCTAFLTKEPLGFARREEGKRFELSVGQHWGDLFDCAWMHFTGTIPADTDIKHLVLLLDVSGEGLCYNEAGVPVSGITNGSTAYEHGSTLKRTVPLNLFPTNGNHVSLWVDAGCNDLFGKYVDSGELKEAAIAIQYPQMRDLYYDCQVLREALEVLNPETARYHCILQALDSAINKIYDFTEEEAISARAELHTELSKQGGDPSLKISAIGHAHIDLAWLWPIRETVRKGARTFSTVLRLMEQYPDYKFGASQPQLLDWMKKYHPSLFERIRERIQEGRFECQGGMWVEADTNLTSGESLVRQILYGTRFWKEEFGVEVDNVWLPDVFGYTGALPQIMQKSGLRYFMTQKLSWNEHNPFPYHTFSWSGIDGSTVLTHMLPEETYNSPASPVSLQRTEKNFHEKGISSDALMLFGIGDGGGGPGVYHLERLARLKNFAGLPPVEQRFASEFFHDINKNVAQYPTWSGELYFENHRGTYTSQARNKRYNRLMEQALRELEYSSVLAECYAGTPYPATELEEIWKEVLLYQFHDILPGSSIHRVYEESVARYETLYSRVCSMINECYEALANGLTAFNSLAFPRTEYLKQDEKWYRAELPAMGNVRLDTPAAPSAELKAHGNEIENEFLRVKFEVDGSISSIWDKEQNKEVLAENACGNRYSVYGEPDGDGWNISIYYDKQKPRYFALNGQTAKTDGISSAMEQTYCYGDSTLSVRAVLFAESRILEFEVCADWHEREKMLRTSFPVDVWTDSVTCDIQFGHLQRPTHTNTSWDWSKFEICAHKWADLSRSDYGVALLNDCKYGYRAQGNVLELDLLRSSTSPDTNADQGVHQFRYALYPHVGDAMQAKVEQKALAFNIRPTIVEGKAKSCSLPKSFLLIDSENIEVTAVKQSEDGNGIIIRLFETNGVQTTANCQLPENCSAVSCDLMENEMSAIMQTGNSIQLKLKPFEIYTLKLGEIQ